MFASTNIDMYELGRAGNVDELKRAISRNPSNLNGPNFQRNALMAAVRFGQLKAVKYLLEQGADLYRIDEDRQTVLYYALRGFSCKNSKRNPNISKEILKILVAHETKLRQENPDLYKRKLLLQDIKDGFPWLPLDAIRFNRDAKPYEAEIRALFQKQAEEIKAYPGYNKAECMQPDPLPAPDMYAKMAEYTEPSDLSFYSVISTGFSSVKEGMISTISSVSCIFRSSYQGENYQLVTEESSAHEHNVLKYE